MQLGLFRPRLQPAGQRAAFPPRSYTTNSSPTTNSSVVMAPRDGPTVSNVPPARAEHLDLLYSLPLRKGRSLPTGTVCHVHARLDEASPLLGRVPRRWRP